MLRSQVLVGAVVLALPVAGGKQLDSHTCTPCSHGNTRGLLGSTFLAQCTSETKHHCVQRLCESSDIECFQETHGKTEFFRSLSTIHTQWHMVGTFVEDNF